MAGGIRSQYPTELAPLFQRILDLEEALKDLQRARVAGVSASSVILQSPNGTSWRLGVTDGGATTWTAV